MQTGALAKIGGQVTERPEKRKILAQRVKRFAH
jgi:hypothetical protein